MTDTRAASAAETPSTSNEQTTAEMALNESRKKSEDDKGEPAERGESKAKSRAQKEADAKNGLREWLKAKKAASEGTDEPSEPKASKPAERTERSEAKAEAKAADKAEKTADKIEEIGGKAPEQKDGESNQDYELRLSKTLRKLRDAEAETVKARKEAQAARDEAAKFDAEVKKFTKLMEDGKANPLTVLEHLGVSYEELTKGIINDKYKVPEKKPQLPPEFLEKIERLEKAEKDREAERVRREGEARRKADEDAVSKYIEENADDFPLVSGWGPAARTIIATAYGAERAATRADLEQLEENLAKEAMGLLGKARGAKALLKRNPELKAALMEALGVSDKPTEREDEPKASPKTAPKSIASTSTEATARPKSREERNRALAAELAEMRRRRDADD